MAVTRIAACIAFPALALLTQLLCSRQVAAASEPSSAVSTAQIRATATHSAVATNSSSSQRLKHMTCEASTAGNHAGTPEEVPSGMEREAELMEAITSIPLVSKAVCRPSRSVGAKGIDITVVATQHNLPANNKRQLQYTAIVPDIDHPQQVFVSPVPTELQTTTLNSLSPSGTRALLAKSHNDGVLLEFWAHNRLRKELLVPKTLHGPVINDGWFSRGATWNNDESIIVYVAELPQSEQTPKFGSSSSSSSSKAGSVSSDSNSSNGAAAAAAAAAAPRTWKGVSAAVEDWGELNTGKRSPSLYALNTKTWQVHQIQGLGGLVNADSSWGQPIWTPDGKGLIAVAWPHKALNFPKTTRRLGIVHCYNRPCGSHYIPYHAPAAAAADRADQQQQGLEVSPVSITEGLLSALSPVFSPDGSKLVFISQEAAAASGVHAATSSLYSLEWSGQPDSSQTPHCIIPTIHKPATPGAFPGLYAYSLHEQGFIDSNTLLITSQWYSQTVILSVGLQDGSVRAVTPTEACKGSWTLQGVVNGLAVATLSAPNHPPQLMIAKLSSSTSSSSSSSSSIYHWTAVEALNSDLSLLPAAAAAAISDVDCRAMDITPTVGDKQLTFQAVVQVPKSRSGPLPAVVVPHGGPHTAVAANFYMPFTLLTALGYCVIAVNYRGSTGFGEANIQSLPGNVGTNDVEDCIAALDAAVAAGYADSSRAAAVGGSHGGFLTGHLVGQHPDRFKCAGLRNPVLNLALMIGVTDIPDWCFIEAYGTQEGHKRVSAEPSLEDLARFHAVSPVAHISHVRAPMIFMLGAKDRRVPLDDGWRYVDALRSRGIETRVLVFPEDTHALDKPQTEFEQWLNIAWWLKQHMDVKQS